MIKVIQRVLIFLRVIKSKGIDKNGDYRTCGFYRWNPLSWACVFILSSIVGVEGFIKGFYSCWRDLWVDKD